MGPGTLCCTSRERQSSSNARRWRRALCLFKGCFRAEPRTEASVGWSGGLRAILEPSTAADYSNHYLTLQNMQE